MDVSSVSLDEGDQQWPGGTVCLQDPVCKYVLSNTDAAWLSAYNTSKMLGTGNLSAHPSWVAEAKQGAWVH